MTDWNDYPPEEKFIEASKLYFPIDPDCNYAKELLIDIKHRREYFIEGCEYQLKEQDNFAIGFADWISLNYFVYNTLEVNVSTKELLEIYKEELWNTKKK